MYYFWFISSLFLQLLYALNLCCLSFEMKVYFLSLPNVYSILFSSEEYGGVVNTTNLQSFINFTILFVLWILALSII